MCQKMYSILFNAVTEAVEHLQQAESEKALALLMKAQADVEEIYISAEDEKEK